MARFWGYWGKVNGQVRSGHPYLLSYRERGHNRCFTVRLFLSVIVTCLLATSYLISQVHSEENDPMKRRQQGILTGMPFMANIAPRTFVDDL
ncbi:MAG: hypothetical protein JSU60_05695, partial [Nitrospirota bacterium]